MSQWMSMTCGGSIVGCEHLRWDIEAGDGQNVSMEVTA